MVAKRPGGRTLGGFALLGLFVAASSVLGSTPTGLSALAGTYQLEGSEKQTTLTIDARGNCSYEFMDNSPFIKASGRLNATADGGFHCSNDPGPAALTLAAQPTTDPRVALTLDALTSDGWRAERLLARVGNKTEPFDLKGRFVLLRLQLASPTRLAVVRQADGRELWSTDWRPGRPNRFLFTYRPSPREPVDLWFRSVPGTPDIQVERGPYGRELLKRFP